MSYPRWTYYPTRDRPPDWVQDFIEAVDQVRPAIDSAKVSGLSSDKVLAHLRPGLEALGYRIEKGKKAHQIIELPVLFGEQGEPRVRYQVDGVHDELGVLLEVEAGRGAANNAAYRDIIRASLIVDARFLVLGMMSEYRSMNKGKESVIRSYAQTKEQLDGIYASERMRLPFEGVLLFGY
jgi:hypothetical protein